MKTITVSKRGNHYLANVYGIRGQQSRESNTIVFNSEFQHVSEEPDYTQPREIICAIAGVHWNNNEKHIGKLIQIAVEGNVNGYTTRRSLLDGFRGSLLVPFGMQTS
ncbi:MAG: hypothetical protein ACOCVA_00810 [Prolixibacteraceae bacterium]